MKHWVVHDDEGKIHQVANGPTAPERDGLSVIEVAVAIDPSCHYVAGGAVVAYSEEQLSQRAHRPSGHVWSNTQMDWVDRRSAEVADLQRAAVARAQRAELIRESDWTQLPDSPLPPAVVEAWAVYRQELRDIPAQPGFPGVIDWPVAPGNAG